MARLEAWYKQDLKKPLVVHRHADVFNQDSRGNLIGVEIYSDGEPVTLTGSIDGYCLLADGTTVSAVGANRTGNKASILIPQTAYNVPGPITITIKNTNGNDITTLCAVVGLVRQSVSGNLVQPGDIVTDWSQSINSQLQAVQDAADNVGAIVAAPFAENTAYVVGNYVTYNGNLYRITADHAAGVTWANTAKTQCTVGTELYDLKSAIGFGFEIGKNLINPAKMVIGLISGSNGAIDSTATSYKTTDFIPVANGQSITVSEYVRRFLAFDANRQPITASYQADQQVNYTYTASADGYIRASYHSDYLNLAQAEYGATASSYEPYCYYLTDNVNFGEKQNQDVVGVIDKNVAGTINLIDQSQYTDGIIDRSNGTIVESQSYKTTEFIPIRANQSITFSPRIRKFLAYNSIKQAITSTYVNADTENYTFTASMDGYIRASFHVDYANISQAEYGTHPSTYIPYGDRRVYPDIKIPVENIENLIANSTISGKKWCACGDSFTQGDFTGLQESEYKLQSGKYIGRNAVYPYIIGNRCNMEVTNLAVGGMTMCCIDGTRQNSFTYNEYYKQIPLDSDYITFKFGINDNNYSSPVGTIEDATIQTFYGAWNVVMDWVTENFPTSKIGIIITNGITDNAGQVYLEATRNICKKWGIPYIDEVADETVPLLLRVKRTGLSDTVYDRKLETFRVSETNLHPNVACHYYESTFIESWLNNL